MTPEERIRMLMEENAMLRARVAGQSGLQTMEYREGMYGDGPFLEHPIGRGTPGATLGREDYEPVAAPQYLAKERPRKAPPQTQYLRKEDRKPKKSRPVGLD
jgi:hypothetical protein